MAFTDREKQILMGVDIDPLTDGEQVLKHHMRDIGEGGGAGVPPVTIADNGKVAKVENGAWAAVDDKLIVTMTEDSGMYTADKTVDEILAADAAGIAVEAVMPQNYRLKLVYVDSTAKIVQFTASCRDVSDIRNNVVSLQGSYIAGMGGDVWTFLQTNVERNEIHVGFTLTDGAQTGEISGTTSAMFPSALAAAQTGKTIICDAEQTLSSGGKIYYRGIMRAVSDGDNSYFACSIPMLNGTKLEVLTITWTSSGVDVDVGQITFDA